eukprot:484352_1
MVLALILTSMFYIKQCETLISCGDSLIYYAADFNYGHEVEQLAPWPYYMNITFSYHQIYDYIKFDGCNNITTIDFGYYIYDQQNNPIYGFLPGEGCLSLPVFTTVVKQDILYHIIIATDTQTIDNILKLDVKCYCNYKCTSKQTISCGDSVQVHGSLFAYDRRLFESFYNERYYYFSNLTFIYNEEIDNIIFDTCNNITTLSVGLYVFDEHGYRIEMVAPELYGCSQLVLETSLLQKNALYYIILASKVYQPGLGKIVKLNMNCHCDCNYLIHQNNLARNDINIHDVINIEFNLKIFSACQSNSSETCNIFQLSSSEYNSLPKLSVDATNHNFIIQFSNNYRADNTFYINKSIDIDNQYHNIKITITNHALLFIYDNITYYNITSTNLFYHTKYELDSNNKYKLYVSNTYDTPMNGTIDRILLNSMISNTYITTYSTNFILVTKLLNWNNALLFCQNNFNASLAAIANDEDFKEIINLRNSISEATKYSDFWIGLTEQEDQINLCVDTDTTCNTNNYLDYRAMFDGSSCGYLVGGNDDPSFAVLNTICDVSNAFVCDRRVNRDLFSDMFVDERSENTCNYFHKTDTNKTTQIIFNDLWLGTNIEISFDIKLNDLCPIDRCDIFYLRNDDNKFGNLHVNEQNHLLIGMFNGTDMEYTDTQFNINQISHTSYDRIDILISESKQSLTLNGKTYFMDYKQLTFDMDILKREKYSLFAGNNYYLKSHNWYSSANTYEFLNSSIDNVCINSNMIRNNDIWYRLGRIEDHDADSVDSVFNYGDSYPIFYHNNITVIVFGDFMWIKYIDNITYYEILKQQQAYPYYTTTNNDMHKPEAWTCPSRLVSTSKCDIESLTIKSQQFLQESYDTSKNKNYLNDTAWNEKTGIEIGYIISSDLNGISYLILIELSAMRLYEFGASSNVQLDDSKFVEVYNEYQLLGPPLVKKWVIPNVKQNYAESTCIASNKTHLFLINKGIIIVNIDNYFDVIAKNDNRSDINYTENSDVDSRSIWVIRNESLQSSQYQLTFNLSNVNSSVFNVSNVGCSINNQNNAIYIFGGLINGSIPIDKVYKYNIQNDSIEIVEKTTLNDPSYNVRAIKAYNDKIYLYGGTNINQNTKRQIFIIDNEMFDENNLIEDDNGAHSTATYNKDQRVIIRYNAENNHQIEYFIPELVSIDFTSTQTTKWRSQKGLPVLYDFRDYNYYTDTYKIVCSFQRDAIKIYSTSTKIYSRYEEMLITKNDCHWCTVWTASTYINTSIVLFTECEPCMTKIRYTFRYNSIKMESDIAIIPTSKTLQFSYLKCLIHIDFPENIAMTSNSSQHIDISVTPSLNCKDNPQSFVRESIGLDKLKYQAIINSSFGGINYLMLVDTEPLRDDGIVNCTVCDMNHLCNDCNYGIIPNCTLQSCNNIKQFVLQVYPLPVYKKWDETAGWIIAKTLQIGENDYSQFSEEIIQDLTISRQSYNISILTNPNGSLKSLKWYEQNLLYIISGSILLFIASIILFYYLWRIKKLQQKIEFQKKHTLIITNPLVVIIATAFYDYDTENPGIKDIYLSDLNGIDIDVTNIKKMCDIYNYDLYPKEIEKVFWTQNEVMELLKKCAIKAANGDYDSILFIGSGHGYDNQLLTSDYQGINKNAIHRLFSANFPSLRELPRIFIYDCCDGEKEYNQDVVEHSDTEDDGVDNGKNITVNDITFDSKRKENKYDIGKNICLNDVIFNHSVEEWARDERNPDYRLITIHAANLGYQSKLNCVDGSYLIREFVLSMMKNAQLAKDEERQYFGEIMDGIQETLHGMGKQQTVNTYNNHTRYVKFGINVTASLKDTQKASSNELYKINKTNDNIIDMKEKTISGIIDKTVKSEILNKTETETEMVSINNGKIKIRKQNQIIYDELVST